MKHISHILLFLLLLTSCSIVAQTDEHEEWSNELQSIQFVGNNSFSSGELQTVIVSQETPPGIWQFLEKYTPIGKGPVYFDSSNIQIDVEALQTFYRERGYFETRIEYAVQHSKAGYALIYNINEGVPSRFRKIEFFGFEKYPARYRWRLDNLFRPDTTALYNQQSVKQKIDEAIYLLVNDGFMYAKSDSTLIIMDTADYRVDCKLYFSTGNLYHISGVDIEKSGPGESSVEEGMLRRLVNIDSLEVYNLSKIRQAQVRLYRTGLFSSVQLAPNIAQATDSTVPVLLTGVVGEMNEMGPELLLNNRQNALNIGLGLGYTRKNFFGEARRFSIEGAIALQDLFSLDYGKFGDFFSIDDQGVAGYTSLRATIEQPFMFNLPVTGRLEFGYELQKLQVFNALQYQSLLRFDFELPVHTFLNFISAYYRFNYVEFAFPALRSVRFKNFIAGLGFDFRAQHANNLIFPTGGYNFSAVVEEGNLIPYLLSYVNESLYDNFSFTKLQLSASAFMSLNASKSLIFASKLRAGTINMIEGNPGDIPVTNLFFVGGSNSVRGWKARELGPQTVDSSNISTVVNYISGGRFMLEGSLELRYKPLENIGAALFIDAGNAWREISDFKPEEVAVAVGFGFRFYTQILAFRLDFGIRAIDPDDLRSVFKKPFFDVLQVHFGIGEAF